MNSRDRLNWQGVDKFSDGSQPMIAEGKYGTLVVGTSNDEYGDITVSIYYGEDLGSWGWGWKIYDNEDEAIKDGKFFSKLLNDPIEDNQLIKFGFEVV